MVPVGSLANLAQFLKLLIDQIRHLCQRKNILSWAWEQE